MVLSEQWLVFITVFYDLKQTEQTPSVFYLPKKRLYDSV